MGNKTIFRIELVLSLNKRPNTYRAQKCVLHFLKTSFNRAQKSMLLFFKKLDLKEKFKLLFVVAL